MNYPKILLRPDDKEEFLNIKDDLYVLKKSLETFPDNLHREYPYDLLVERGFYDKNLHHLDKYCFAFIA